MRDDTCGKSVLFSQAEAIVMGVYIGLQYTKTGAAQLLSGFQDHQNMLDKYVASHLALEVCGEKSVGPEVIGLFVDTTGNTDARHGATDELDGIKKPMTSAQQIRQTQEPPGRLNPTVMAAFPIAAPTSLIMMPPWLSSDALGTTNPSIGTARVCICQYENPPLCQFRRYEGENNHLANQVCQPSDIDKDIYTHIYAFASITSDSAVNISEYTDVFDQFDQLTGTEPVATSYDPYCAQIYAVDTLGRELAVARVNYTAVDTDYDDYFGYYVDYTMEMVPSVLNSYMNDVNGPGDQYFDCTWNRDGVNTTRKTCPFPDIELGEGSYKLLEEGCQLGTRTWYGFPRAASNIVVSNPKDVVTAAGANMTKLMDQIQETSVDLLLAQWDGSALGAAQPSARRMRRPQKKELILTIVTAVLAVFPFVGDAFAAAGLEDVARAIALIGETTNAVFDLYTIFSDPASAPMAILGMMLGSAALGRDSQSFSKMGKLRREMSEDALPDMGEDSNNTLINTIVRPCTS
ncbi:hypothetical protein AnigIFM62618_006801 [Aspergillus niger]|nr:hypothetical protein AnigIFM62618_006801 [Aspergillus niger]